MKKIVLLSVVVFGMSLASCEKEELNEELSFQNEELEIYQVDKEEIERPGEQGGNQ
ncbi:hypothetical protein U6A24_12755 [Aquimarina gracilis]|uniref:Secreted protein n=1 Tax=Aquimarina gracilis TaxID=874422 RepID=A0ABU5ZWT9_9FLAO|nr:hypothetical protein [Aquimarina gracilis]MEB3346340.1 hypothetical protein [Aquimarina gracilis]